MKSVLVPTSSSTFPPRAVRAAFSMLNPLSSADRIRQILPLTPQTIAQLRQSLYDHVEQDDQVSVNIQQLKK